MVVDQVTPTSYDMGKLKGEDPSSNNEKQEGIEEEPYKPDPHPITLEIAPNPAPMLAPVPIVTPDSIPPPPAPAPTPKCEHVVKWIDHDKIKPFRQPDPVSVTELAALKFQPMIKISGGCHAYPMVTAEGETSSGLKTTGATDGNCRGAQWGSQIYGRAAWYRKYFVIMYLLYFPKDSPTPGMGHRHDFEEVHIYINNPAEANPTVLAVAASAHGKFEKHAPPHPSIMNGTHAKIRYFSQWPLNHQLEATTEEGGFQELIMWHQLPEKARCALNTVYWGKANNPMRDENFWKRLEKSFPF
ncbi:unnamed protein product [Peronospora farinosa]|uniref:Uncharacterized protein n=1 Tax=Peronospora farinosa TaxID=134698 RepID=A0AAV0TA89_9STRA|nr:unnamed protein product [Peronospora farinosa]CAI5715650.1 unnamed protein product [Peronospora farinosa]